MKEIRGDIWDFHKNNKWIVITTNGFVKKNGECVMGRGIALQAKQKYPNLPKKLGEHITHIGNKVFFFEEKIISFPTKHNFWDKSDIKLIEQSCKDLLYQLNYPDKSDIKEIYMPRPGCGNGKLQWGEVKFLLEKYLDDRFIIVNNN